MLAGYRGGEAWRRLRPPTSLVLHLSDTTLARAAACTECGARRRRVGCGPARGLPRSAGADQPGPAARPARRPAAATSSPTSSRTAAPRTIRDDVWSARRTPTTRAASRAAAAGRPGLRDQIVVRPVLDPLGQVPVDAYEPPPEMREAVESARPSRSSRGAPRPARRATSTTPIPSRPPPSGEPPPGQTRPGNLGPLEPTAPQPQDPPRVALLPAPARTLPVADPERVLVPRRPPRHHPARHGGAGDHHAAAASVRCQPPGDLPLADPAGRRRLISCADVRAFEPDAAARRVAGDVRLDRGRLLAARLGPDSPRWRDARP